jgi:hypothetical protein
LFYRTGSAHKSPIIGTTSLSGGNERINKSVNLGAGLAAQMAVHLGSQGSNTAGGGCQSGMGGFVNTSSGNIVQACTNVANTIRSRYVSWINRRE